MVVFVPRQHGWGLIAPRGERSDTSQRVVLPRSRRRRGAGDVARFFQHAAETVELQRASTELGRAAWLLFNDVDLARAVRNDEALRRGAIRRRRRRTLPDHAAEN